MKNSDPLSVHEQQEGCGLTRLPAEAAHHRLRDPLQRRRALRELPERSQSDAQAVQSRFAVSIKEPDLLDLGHESVGRAARPAQQRGRVEHRDFRPLVGKQGEDVIQLLEHDCRIET